MQQTIFVPHYDSCCGCYAQPRPDQGWKHLIVHLICVQLPALVLVHLRAHLSFVLCPKNKTSYIRINPQSSQSTANKAVRHVQASAQQFVLLKKVTERSVVPILKSSSRAKPKKAFLSEVKGSRNTSWMHQHVLEPFVVKQKNCRCPHSYTRSIGMDLCRTSTRGHYYPAASPMCC